MMKKYVYQFEAMTTPCELILYANNKTLADTSAKAVLNEAKRLEYKYNYFSQNSVVTQINQRTLIVLDQETKDILQRAKKYYTETNKVFDITLATIKNIYVEEVDSTVLKEKKEHLLTYVGCEHFSIKKNKIYFDNPYTKIDLGGFVKEYVVDRGVKILKKHKITSALINFGGDIYALGKKPDGEQFRIGIKNPLEPSKYACEETLENQALTTSASYERKNKVGLQMHSHILSKDKETSLSRSVSVISSNCVQSGVYATALMVDLHIKTNHKTIIL
ncbi:FAD:protein FMN transferase [Sulfurimonas sp. SAG-AH-194-I05]|nr:FAD:protein FMN transferase [Sulfurimonas sp. SAG-AH-194-I05]MDF1875952.1 FAD:protein FMN transferase [Sulfurimonas sp. SAG-AH-194-I05]